MKVETEDGRSPTNINVAAKGIDDLYLYRLTTFTFRADLYLFICMSSIFVYLHTHTHTHTVTDVVPLSPRLHHLPRLAGQLVEIHVSERIPSDAQCQRPMGGRELAEDAPPITRGS